MASAQPKTGTLDGFPSVSLVVVNEEGESVSLVDFDPAEVGNSVFSLFPLIGSEEVDVSCSGVATGAGACENAKK